MDFLLAAQFGGRCELHGVLALGHRDHRVSADGRGPAALTSRHWRSASLKVRNRGNGRAAACGRTASSAPARSRERRVAQADNPIDSGPLRRRSPCATSPLPCWPPGGTDECRRRPRGPATTFPLKCQSRAKGSGAVYHWMVYARGCWRRMAGRRRSAGTPATAQPACAATRFPQRSKEPLLGVFAPRSSPPAGKPSLVAGQNIKVARSDSTQASVRDGAAARSGKY